jgi:hypothetical protein
VCIASQRQDLNKEHRSQVTESRFGRGLLGGLVLAFAWGIGHAQVSGTATFWASLVGIGFFMAFLIIWSIAAFSSDIDYPETTGRKLSYFAPWGVVILIQSGLGWWILGSGRLATLSLALGLALTPLLWPRRPRLRRETTVGETNIELEEARLPWGLPATLGPHLDQLPELLPQPLELVINDGLEDYVHLLAVLDDFPAAGSLVEAAEVQGNATLTLQSLLQQAQRATKMMSLESSRPDDAQAVEASAAAQHRLRELGQILHDTTSAALRFVSTSGSDAAADLREKVERVQALAEAREELKQIG